MLSNGNFSVFTFLKSDAKASRLLSRGAVTQPAKVGSDLSEVSQGG